MPFHSLTHSLMAPQNTKTVTDYELQRLENIRRNAHKISSLLLLQKASALSSSLKPKPTPRKSKPETRSPSIPTRRSLRTRGVPPSDSPDPPPAPLPPPMRDPLSIHSSLITLISSASSPSDPGPLKNSGFDPISELVLRPEHAVKLVTDRILSVQFLPFTDREIIAVGNKIGDLGFWNANHQEGGDDVDNGVYVYHPHSSPVSGISVHHFSPQKIYSCGYDGLIRSMDVEKEVFSTVESSDYSKLSICQWPNEANLVYVGEGEGYVKVWDERVGKASSVWELHERRINSIDFCSENVNLMLTGSTDGVACIWDLRNMKKGDAWGYESLKRIEHEKAVHSAYFSPNGKFLATTSADDKVGIVSGSNFDDISMVYHNNWTGRWLSSFRAIWGWDDSYLFLGNMKRAIDVISICDKTTRSLESPDMTSIPCRFAVHPYMLGHLAGTTSGGKVFLWTKE